MFIAHAVMKLRSLSGTVTFFESLGLIEVWIDETERRTWFLFEASRPGDSSGH
jgi:starvation-inducible DNA-binding protein